MIQLEDQTFPKRCGHLDGKAVVSVAEMQGKLSAALFVEALRTPEQMDAACRRFAHRVPLLANMVEGGKTPVHSADGLAARGFRIVIFPGGAARAVAHTLAGYYASLHAHGSTLPWRNQMLDFDGLNAVIGTPALLALGKQYSEDK